MKKHGPRELAALLTGNRRIVVRRPSLGPCWEWTRTTAKEGYGKISVGGRMVVVSRVAGWLWKGWPLWGDHEVCHKCDNPPCFNPAHLFSGTGADNAQDALAKGRFVQGSRVHWATLDEARVAQIKALLGEVDATGKRRYTQRALAERFGVTQPTISRIASGRKWAHVKGAPS